MLEELFISKVRVKIIALFIKNPEGILHVREITRRVGAEINAVRRELDRLTKIKMLKREERGNRVYYKLRENFPLFGELLSLLSKEEGLGKNIIENQTKLGRIKFAVLSEKLARGEVAKPTEIDLLIVGKVSLDYLSALIKTEEGRIGREINYSVMGEEEHNFRKKRRDSFIIDFLLQPRIMLIGDGVEFSRF